MRERLVPGPYLSPSAHRARKRAWVRGYLERLPKELHVCDCCSYRTIDITHIIFSVL